MGEKGKGKGRDKGREVRGGEGIERKGGEGLAYSRCLGPRKT